MHTTTSNPTMELPNPKSPPTLATSKQALPSQKPQPEPQSSILTRPPPKSNPCLHGFTVFTGKIKFNPIHTMVPSILLYREGQILPVKDATYDQFILDPDGDNVMKVVASTEEPAHMVEIGWVPLSQRHNFIELCMSTRSSMPRLPATERCQGWVDDVLAQARMRGYIVIRS